MTFVVLINVTFIIHFQVISLRIASRFGGEAQEIVLHSGSSQEGGNKVESDSANGASSADNDLAAPIPGPSNAPSFSSTLRNVAQIIAAGESL